MRACYGFVIAAFGLTSGCASGLKVSVADLPVRVRDGLKTESSVQSVSHFATIDGGGLTEQVVRRGEGAGKVALVDVDGVFLNESQSGPYSAGENPVSLFAEKLAAAAKDPEVRAVVLRVNSPGGSVAATDLMTRELAAFRKESGKPVVAAILDVGAGGAYFLATGADSVQAIPTALVGGIGVVFDNYFLEVAMGKLDIYTDGSVKAGDKTDMGSVVRKQSEEEKALFKAMAAEYQASFHRAVRGARPAVAADSAVLDGRVMTASTARAAGLIDRVGHLAEAYDEAARRAGVAGCPPVVMYSRAATPLRTAYATAPNRPIHTSLIPISLPGLDRGRLPQFMYLWSPDPTLGHRGS